MRLSRSLGTKGVQLATVAGLICAFFGLRQVLWAVYAKERPSGWVKLIFLVESFLLFACKLLAVILLVQAIMACLDRRRAGTCIAELSRDERLTGDADQMSSLTSE